MMIMFMMELNDVCSTEHNQLIISDTFVLFKNVDDNEDINRSSITEIVERLSKLADAVLDVTSCSGINMFQQSNVKLITQEWGSSSGLRKIKLNILLKAFHRTSNKKLYSDILFNISQVSGRDAALQFCWMSFCCIGMTVHIIGCRIQAKQMEVI